MTQRKKEKIKATKWFFLFYYFFILGLLVAGLDIMYQFHKQGPCLFFKRKVFNKVYGFFLLCQPKMRGGGPDPPPPYPTCQQKLRNWHTPLPPWKKKIWNWLTPPTSLSEIIFWGTPIIFDKTHLSGRNFKFEKN